MPGKPVRKKAAKGSTRKASRKGPGNAASKRKVARTRDPVGKATAKRAPARKIAADRSPAKKPKPKARLVDDEPGDGSAAVAAYISVLPAWQKELAQQLDQLIADAVPGVRKTVKWHSPTYGTAHNGWFVALGSFKAHLKLNFFRGADLKPGLPGGVGKYMRSIDYRQGDPLDEEQLAKWVKQAASRPGMGAI